MYRRDQLYATAAAGGALVVYLLHGHLTPFQAQVGGALAVLLLRWVSRRGWVRLPVRRLPGGRETSPDSPPSAVEGSRYKAA